VDSKVISWKIMENLFYKVQATLTPEIERYF
jgi:hypothetical protein